MFYAKKVFPTPIFTKISFHWISRRRTCGCKMRSRVVLIAALCLISPIVCDLLDEALVKVAEQSAHASDEFEAPDKVGYHVVDPFGENRAFAANVLSTLWTDGFSSSYFRGNLDDYWKHMRRLRMKWIPSVNSILVPQNNTELFLSDFMYHVHYRFFTGFDLDLSDARRQDLIFHNINYIFLFHRDDQFQRVKAKLTTYLKESINCWVVTAIKDIAYIYYSKATPDGSNTLTAVNEWSRKGRFILNPLFPPIRKVYSDLKRRILAHPVMHKPPWNFVTYDRNGEMLEENGGRDDTLLQIIAEKMNFEYVPIDPKNWHIRRYCTVKLNRDFLKRNFIWVTRFRSLN